MKKIYLVILIINQYFLSSSQFSVKIINDNFNSNLMRWDIHQNENSELNIQDGKYLISGLKEGTAVTSTIEAPHIQSSNYSITTSLLKVKGIDDNGYGLVWGSIDANNEFEFVISGNGQFKIVQWDEGNKTELFPWTFSTAINKWDFAKNVLKIQNQNNILRFYINDTYVAAFKELPVRGNRVGFVINEEMNIEVDYIIVENLTISQTESPDNLYNLEINDLLMKGSANNAQIKYNESAILNIQMSNKGNNTLKDLILKVRTDEQINGLEFNKIIMIEKINANETQNYTLKFNANEEIPTQDNIFTIDLVNLNGEKIDSKNISIKTIGISKYYENQKNENANSNSNTNIDPNRGNTNIPKNNYGADGCTKGCTSVGLISLLTLLILAII